MFWCSDAVRLLKPFEDRIDEWFPFSGLCLGHFYAVCLGFLCVVVEVHCCHISRLKLNMLPWPLVFFCVRFTSGHLIQNGFASSHVVYPPSQTGFRRAARDRWHVMTEKHGDGLSFRSANVRYLESPSMSWLENQNYNLREPDLLLHFLGRMDPNMATTCR